MGTDLVTKDLAVEVTNEGEGFRVRIWENRALSMKEWQAAACAINDYVDGMKPGEREQRDPGKIELN